MLYFAREVLIPLALAILFSFLLAPAVRRLERWLPRILATLLMVILVFSFIGAVAVIAGKQAVSLGAKLPEYRENIMEKIQAFRSPTDSDLGKAADAIKDLQEEAASERPPLRVKESPGSPLEAIAELIAPFAQPVGTTLAVIVLTILLLMHRENMRERLLGLIGPRRIHLMTRAMSEASYRVSSYLYMQLVVNAMFGIPFAIALYFIGVPNALLWGLLGMLLRFIPYAGVWVAAALPTLLAFAISDGWSMAAWTVGTFFALEMVLVYAVEPWLYGRSAGLAPIAIILSAVFWTWLWGPIGLLLATPLTVCVTVIGRYVPELGYLNVLLGVEPVLSPDERFYQRLVALDQDDAAEAAEKHAATQGLAAAFDAVVIPALSLAEIDRRKGTLEPARERFIYEATRNIVEDVGDDSVAAGRLSGPPVCIVPAHDEADHIAGMMLARLLAPGQASLASLPVTLAEVEKTVEKAKCGVICISAVPPHAANRAGYLARRLRNRLPPGVKILVGLWSANGDAGNARERLTKLGVDDVVTTLAAAADQIRQPAAAAPRKPVPVPA